MNTMPSFGKCAQCGEPLRKMMTEDRPGEHDYTLVCTRGHETGQEWTEYHFASVTPKANPTVSHRSWQVTAAGVVAASVLLASGEIYLLCKVLGPLSA